MVKKPDNKVSPTILVVEDDESLCHLIKRRLDRAGFDSEVAFSGAGAIRRAASSSPALVLLDYKLPDMTAEEVIAALNEHTIPFIIATGQGDEKTAVAMMKLGARDYVIKDYNFLDRLPQVVKQTLDRLDTESKLRDAEETLRQESIMRGTMLDNLPCIALVLKKDTREIVASNRDAREIGAVPGMTCYQTCADRADDCPFCLAPKLWATGEPQQLEVEYRGKWYTGIWVPLTDDLYVHYIFDITERKHAEEAVRESEHYLSDAQSIAHIGNWRLDVITQDVEGSDELFRIFGLSRDEISLEAFSGVVHPDDSEYVLSHIRRGIETGAPYDIEHRLVCKDGAEKYVHAIGEAVKDDAGKIVLLVGTVQDITERKRAEAQIRKLSSAVDQSIDGVAINDRNHKIVYSNETYAVMHGYTHQEILELRFRDLIPKGEGTVWPVIRKLVISTDSWSGETDHSRKDGTIFPAYISITKLRDDNGEQTGVLSICRDITESKRAEEELSASEEKYANLVERGNDGIIIIQGNSLKFVNSKMAKMTGYTRKELIGKAFIEFVAPEHKKTVMDRYQKRMSGKKVPNEYEVAIVRKNDTQMSVEINASLTEYEGAPADMAIIRDITERKKYEQALVASEVKTRAILSAIPDMIFVMKKDGTITDFIPSSVMKSPIPAHKFLGRKIVDVLPPEMAASLMRLLAKAFESGKLQSDEGSMQLPDGEHYYDNRIVVLDKDTALGIAQDITERKQAEAKLKDYADNLENMVEVRTAELADSEEWLRILLSSTSDTVYAYYRDENGKAGNFIEVNDAAIRMMGYTREEFSQMTPYDLAVTGSSGRRHQGRDQLVFESIHVTKDGHELPVEVSANLFQYKGSTISVCIVRDITERKAIEQERKDSEERYRTLFNNTADAVYMYDRSDQGNPGKIIDANDVAIKLYGYTKEELTKMTPLQLANPEPAQDYSSQRKEFDKKGSVIFESVHRTKDGRNVPVEVSAHALVYKGLPAAISVIRDITERKAIEQERKETAEKLATVGQLASGIAHELRNPLAIINNAAYFIGTKVKSDDVQVQKSLAFIQQEVFRSSHIIEGLLDLARTKQPNYAICDISDTFSQVLEHITKPENIIIKIKCQKNIPKLLFDSMQVERVFNNMITNAMQSMSDGGKLTIEYNVEGKFLVVRISDTGYGIADEDIGKVFEPMYTTKESMGGIGIGLAVSKSIIDAHKGTIAVESTLSKGTTFTVKLPAKTSM